MAAFHWGLTWMGHQVQKSRVAIQLKKIPTEKPTENPTQNPTEIMLKKYYKKDLFSSSLYRYPFQN